MCGILGYFRKTTGIDDQLGATMLSMLNALGRRGPDSAGVAMVGPTQQGRLIVRVQTGDELEMSEHAIQANLEAIEAYVGALDGAADISSSGVYVRFMLAGDVDLPVDLPALIRSLEALGEGIEVLSIGHGMELSKEVGTPHLLEGKHHISSFAGTHGIGHTRLCTESTVDLSHSQPFWGRGAADVAVVHNGHITNYHQLRRKYEQRGIRFVTENDSEVLAVYLAESMNRGDTLRQGLDGVLRDMDGAFCCLAVTATEMGYVKDPYAFKPLVMAETDDFVAVATEEIAIRSAIPGNYKVSEAQVEEVRVWSEIATTAIDAATLSTREINALIRTRLGEGGGEICVENPNARHNLAVALLQPGRVRFLGSVGYYCGGLIDGAGIEIEGSAGWGLAESMNDGHVVVQGGAGNGAGAAIRGGSVVIYGDAAARLGVSMKGGLVLVGGDCGYMAGFMGQKGTLVVCGNTGHAFADSMYATTCYVGGKIGQLGTDAVSEPLSPAEAEQLDQLLAQHLPPGLRAQKPAACDFTKVVSGRKLWNFDKHNWKDWQDAL